MPTGVYERDMNLRYGARPTCKCGVCALCRQRIRNRKHYKKIRRARLDDVTDAELEQRLVEYFKEKGWD